MPRIHPQHSHFLQRQDYPLQLEDSSCLTKREQELLSRYGHWMEALAEGRLVATSISQRKFVRASEGEIDPSTEYEHAWIKLLTQRELERIERFTSVQEMPGPLSGVSPDGASSSQPPASAAEETQPASCSQPPPQDRDAEVDPGELFIRYDDPAAAREALGEYLVELQDLHISEEAVNLARASSVASQLARRLDSLVLRTRLRRGTMLNWGRNLCWCSGTNLPEDRDAFDRLTYLRDHLE